jgi:diguanylate cyclase (GGDEF)-like protein
VFGLLIVAAAAAAVVTGDGGSVRTVIWCYPVVVAVYLVLRRTAAAACSVALLVTIVALLGRSAGADVAIRCATSLTLVIGVLHAMLLDTEELERTLIEQAVTDPLTGAFNRRHLDACLRMVIERRNRTGEPASLLLIDVDHFKHINDACGHAAGDDVLRGLVRVIGGRMRTLDLLFRIGGEEFALLLAGAGHHDAIAVAEDLRLLVKDSRLLDGGAVSISVGVSELQRGQSGCAWLADADAAMYRAKRAGRNRVAGRALANAC